MEQKAQDVLAEPPGRGKSTSADVNFGKGKTPSGFGSREFRKRFYPGVRAAEWNDWRWQVRNRVRDGVGLSRFLELMGSEVIALGDGAGLPVAVTPYYLSVFWDKGADHPLRRCVVPTAFEKYSCAGEEPDPLAEDRDSPAPGLVHRYPDRVLFMATGFCSAYCRYCTRSRKVGRDSGMAPSRKRWEQCLAYIESTPAIRDVVVSGGDPLTLDDDALEWLLGRLRRIPHVEMIRLGTKVPMVLPQRITPALVKMLRKFHPLYMSIHATHPDELTPEVSRVLNRIANAGIPMGSQTVLLRDVNDDPSVMRALMHGLLLNRVRPYYLYQCDPVPGTAHFRTPVECGLEIIESLRGHTSGYAVPSFVIDAPGGGGKIPLLPQYALGRKGDMVELRNYKHELFQYPDPQPKTQRVCTRENA